MIWCCDITYITWLHSNLINLVACREDARGVAGVASATPKFENLFYKLGSKIFLKKSLFTVCYTILKFLPSSLVACKLSGKLDVS